MTANRSDQGLEMVAAKVAEKKYSLEQAAMAVGISPSGLRLLLNNKKLGYCQSGKRKLIGEVTFKNTSRLLNERLRGQSISGFSRESRQSQCLQRELNKRAVGSMMRAHFEDSQNARRCGLGPLISLP
jgi:hypothetical protein